MTTLHSIRQRIEALRVEARGINAAAGDNALDAAAETRFAAIEAEVATLRNQERRAAFVDDADRAAPGVPVGGGDNRFDELRSGISLSAVIRAQMAETRSSHEAGRVREISAEIARRSGRTPANGLLWDSRSVPEPRTLYTGQGPTPNGAALVPLVQRPDMFIDVMRSALVVQQAGARIITDLQGDISVPRKTATSAPAFVLEGQPLPLSDTAYDSLKMKPKTAGVVSELSRNLVLQSSPSAESLVMDDQAKSVAQLIDTVALLGSGAGATPFGVIPQATARTYDAAGAPSWGDVLDSLDALEAANIMPAAWVAGAGVRGRLMRQPRSATLSEGFVMQDRGTLAGLPFLQTGNMPQGTLVVGDFSELTIGYWGGVEIVVNEFAQDAFMRGNVLVRAIVTLDVLVRRPEAFVKLSPA